MIGVARTSQISSAESKFITHARCEFRAQFRHSPFFNDECKPAFRACLARTMVAENLHEFYDDGGCLIGLDEDIQMRSDREPAGAHFPAYEDVKSSPLAFFRRHQGDILRLVGRAVVQAAGDGNVELPRKVGECRIAVASNHPAIEFADDL